MDGENHGKPYEQMDDLGGFPIFRFNTHIMDMLTPRIVDPHGSEVLSMLKDPILAVSENEGPMQDLSLEMREPIPSGKLTVRPWKSP